MHTLVTFLGKARDNPQTGYRTANYRFPDGLHTTAFFGLELARFLKPDRVVMLGTTGSQWDLLAENLNPAGEDDEKVKLLTQAVNEGTLDQMLLDGLAPLLTRAVGSEVIPCLIPYGADLAEQMAILEAIARAVPRGEVSFDVTHGLRHLGMVGFLSAFMLERINKLDVKGLWYGALDMTADGVTPVLRLDGLSAVQAWIEALDKFDATGDYGVFAQLLVNDGVPAQVAQQLQEAAYHERHFNLTEAASRLRSALPELEKPLSGASALFQNQLRKRLEWAQAPELGERQRKPAYQYLKRGDFVRAAIFGWEALITKACQEYGLDPSNFQEGRRSAQEQLKENMTLRTVPAWKREAFQTLRELRNALAHGDQPRNKRHRRLLLNPAELQREIEACLQRLLLGSQACEP